MIISNFALLALNTQHYFVSDGEIMVDMLCIFFVI